MANTVEIATFGRRNDVAPARFGRSFVKSGAFKALFREGMNLIEETASYLDGDGRTASAGLNRTGALTYASESMRLTTRLMQVASWLLVQRAISEGELTVEQAQREARRVRLVPQEAGSSEREMAVLPERLHDLIEASYRLHARVMHLDTVLNEDDDLPAASPALRQLDTLRLALLAS